MSSLSLVFLVTKSQGMATSYWLLSTSWRKQIPKVKVLVFFQLIRVLKAGEKETTLRKQFAFVNYQSTGFPGMGMDGAHARYNFNVRVPF